MVLPAVQLIAKHVLHHLADNSPRPLFVAIQGPQGSGKSFLTGLVHSFLSDEPHSLRVASLSIDDLYLPHDGLKDLAETHPHNPLWRGRGQPGTHDLALGIDLLKSLKSGVKEVEIPRFEKSLFNGEGDRLPLDGSGVVVKPPLDVVIMEGWFMGFYPISGDELEKRWNGVWKDVKESLEIDDSVVGTRENIAEVNDALFSYMDLWSFFDVCVQIKPKSSETSPPYSIVYKWRLEQEHNMKARNGGNGMTDSAVKFFVDRYIPGYVFFGDGISQGYVGGKPTGDRSTIGGTVPQSESPVHDPPHWIGKSICLVIDEQREIAEIKHF